MDPNAALKELVTACADDDRSTALERLEALRGWIEGGGFLPRHAAYELLGRPLVDFKAINAAEDWEDALTAKPIPEGTACYWVEGVGVFAEEPTIMVINEVIRLQNL